MRGQSNEGIGEYLLNGPGVKDLYDSEKKALRDIAYKMRFKHSFRGVRTIAEEDQIKASFAHEMRNRCAEIGLVTDVQWLWEDEKTGARSPDVSDDPDDNTLYWIPRVVVTGRTETLSEYDHDQQQYEITHGVLEEPGYIRPDGTISEDPKKKDIY